MRAPALLAVDGPGTPDGLLQGRAHGRVELLQGAGERGGRHPHLIKPDAVEPLGEVDQRRVAPMMHVLADRTHLLQGGRYVELGSGQQVTQGGALGQGVAAQIDSGDHVLNSLRPECRAVRTYQWLIQHTAEARKIPFTFRVRPVTQRA